MRGRGRQRFPGLQDVAGVREAQHDPVVGGHHPDLRPQPLAQSFGDDQRPGRVDLGTVGGVNDHPPVAQVVLEPLDHDRLVGGEEIRRRELLAQVGGGVLPCPLAGLPVADGGGDPPWVLDGLSDPAPEVGPEFGVATGGVPLPERQPSGLTGGGGDQHAVGRDLLDPPRAGAESEGVADPRLEDHLLVELPDPAAASCRCALRAGCEEYAEQATIGNRPTGGDSQSLGSRSCGQGVGRPVPHEPGSQRGEVLARIPPGKHVQHGLERGPAQALVGAGPPDQGSEFVEATVTVGAHGDDLLCQDVERLLGRVHLLDLAGARPLREHRRGEEFTAVHRDHHGAREGTDLVPGASQALQEAGDGVRGAHLDHDVDRAHVDPQFQRRGRDHGREETALELLLDRAALLQGHRAVVRSGEQARRAQGGA